jgi:acetyl-CoA acetyltransferase
MATGIKDKVAIIGMGCSKFGERWDREADDLIVEAFEECAKDAGIERDQIDAACSRPRSRKSMSASRACRWRWRSGCPTSP